MYDLESLKSLVEGGCTYAIAKGEKLFSGKERGIRPLLELIGSGEDVRGAVAADKIVGKAAALLYAYMSIQELYAGVLSESGLAVLREYGIAVQFGALAERIINRAGTGICPMEETVENIADPAAALAALQKRAAELAGK